MTASGSTGSAAKGKAKELGDLQLALPAPLRPPFFQERQAEITLLLVPRPLPDTDPGKTSLQAHLAQRCWKPANGAVDELPGGRLSVSNDT